MILNLLIVLTLSLINTPQICIKSLYDGDLIKARSIFNNLEKTAKTEEMKFLNAYYNTISEQALPIYKELYEQTKNEIIKYLVTKKLYEYNYARGLYTTSTNFYKVMISLKQDSSTPILSDSFVIQCGVFTAESNALALKEKISSVIKNNVYLKATIIDGEHLIRVLIGDFSSVQEAEKVQNTIQQKLLLSTMIKSKNH